MIRPPETMYDWTTATIPHRRKRVLRVAFGALLPALLLAGCGSSSDQTKLEARIVAAEAKAESADKRSREALSMVASAPSPQEAGTEADPETLGDEPIADEGFGDADIAEVINSPAVPPPPPPIMPGG